MNSADLSEVHHRLARGEFTTAENMLREILNPEAPDPSHLVLLSAILAKQERFEEGLELLDQVLKQEAGSIDAWIWLSICLRNLGRLEEAEEACLNALKYNPKDPRVNFNLGLCYIDSRQYEKAAAHFIRALDVQRNNPHILQNLGLACQGAGNDEQALSCFRKSIEFAPDAHPSHVALGALVLKYGNSEGALSSAIRALEISPNSIPAHVLAARAYTLLNRLPESRRHLERILEVDPADATAHMMLGTLLQTEGDFDGAASAFQKSLALDPNQGAAHWGILQGKKRKVEDRHKLPRILQIAENGRLDPNERALLYYSMAKINEDTGHFGEAFKCYESANALAERAAFGTNRFSASAYRSKFSKAKEVFSSGFLREHRDLAHGSDRPIFIVGMIRSGTTLMEQILSNHPAVVAGGELTFWLERSPQCINLATATLDYSKSRESITDYLELLNSISLSAEHVTDKMPQNVQNLGLINLLLPNAKILNMNRNPVANCLSIYTTPFAFPPEFALNRENIAVAYEETLRLTAHWREVLPVGTMLDVSYEDLTADPQQTIKAVLDHCQLPWSDSCLKPQENPRTVYTPSLWQVRQPIYRTSTERWSNFAGLMPEFEGILS